MRETWKDIIGYEGKYQVSYYGRVKSINYRGTGKEVIFTPWISRYGYPMVSLRKDGVKTGYSVHLLVWKAFKGPIPPGMQVNHINEDKMDNRLENLNLMTPKENCNWGTRNKRIGNKVVQLGLDGRLIDFYDTATEAENKLHIFGTSIISCCRGTRAKSAGGYKWKYYDDFNPLVIHLLRLEYLHRSLYSRPPF